MNKLIAYTFSALSFFLAIQISTAQTSSNQDVIKLYNPSFEDMPRASKAPVGWYDCGFPGETPPDTQPDTTFRVAKLAQDGNTYLGLVTRDNDTWESVGQRLSRPLRANQCYSFSIYLSRSVTYKSWSQVSQQKVNYDTPSVLRIWGGAAQCDKRELLAETAVIKHDRWIEYNFKLSPKQTHTYIIFEAVYQMPTLFPTNGNLLLDNASPIKLMPCDKDIEEVPSPREEPILAVATKTKPKLNQKPKQKEIKPNQETKISTTAEVSTKPKISNHPKTPQQTKPKILADLDRKKLRKGQIIRISKLFFEADTFAIRSNSYPVLEEIYQFLKSNPNVVVEIGGHTNNIPDPEFCDWLSEKRAKEVADYLSRKGISSRRLQYKGYGKRHPIASNRTAVGRKRNQRVEIKILSLDG